MVTGTQVVVGVDGHEAYAEFQRIMQAALRAGDSIETAFSKGAVAMQKVQTTGENTSRKLERQARNYEQQLLRQNALIQSGGQRNADYFEAEAKRRGLLTDAVRRQIDVMRQLEAQTKKTSAAGGISAGQHAAAMRNLPAQMTDITVGLATGQSPFMVLMQQGGQLKDMFGGIVPAAKAVGGAVTGFVLNPITLAIGAVGGLAYAMYKGAEEAHAYNRALILSGNAAGTTADQMAILAGRVGDQTGSYGAAREAMMAMVESGKVAAVDMEHVGAAVVRMHQATGQSVEDLVKAYADIAKDPLKALLAINEKTGVFTSSVYLQARALKEQGKEQEAVRLVQNVYAEETERMAKEASENIGLLEKAWNGVKTAATSAWENAKKIGAPETDAEKVARLSRWIQSEQEMAARAGRAPVSDLSDWQEELRRANARMTHEKLLAELEAQRKNDNEQSAAASDRLANQAHANASKQVKLAERLAEIERDRLAALKTATEEQKKQINLDAAQARAQARKQFAPSFDLDAILRSQAIQESGFGRNRGHQFHPDTGKVVLGPQTRYGRAVGIAQVIPQFGPDYARMAGVDWNEQKLYSSAEYGMTLMRGGMQNYLKRYDNDIRKALAAYNWGPGNLNSAIRRHGDNWEANAPAETRNYISKILGRVGIDGQGDFKAGDPFKVSGFDAFMAQMTEAATQLRSQLAGTTDANPAGKLNAFDKLAAGGGLAGWTPDQAKAASEAAQVNALLEEELQLKQQLAQAEQQRIQRAAEQSLSNIEANDETIRQLKLEMQFVGGTQLAMDALTHAREQDAIAEKERQALAVGDPATANLLRREADQLREIAGLRRQQREMPVSLDWTEGARSGLKVYLDDIKDVNRQIEDTTVRAFESAADSLTDFVTKGKMDFSSLADSVISDIVRITMQQGITAPLASWFGGFLAPNALGGVYNSPGLSAYSGQIVSKPTLFPFAKGTGLMGEAGPEAILPLKRGPGGYLGVRSEGGGGVTVNVINQSGAHVETRERTDESGMPVIDVLLTQLDRRMAAGIRSGNSQSGQAMQTTFGLRRRGQ